MPVSQLFAVVAAFEPGISAPAFQPSTAPVETTISAQAEAMESVTLGKVEAAVAAQLRAHEARRNEIERLKLEQTAVASSDGVFEVDGPTDPLALQLVVARPVPFRF